MVTALFFAGDCDMTRENKLLLLINAVESLPYFTQDVLAQARDGESWECLIRQLEGINRQALELSSLAKETKVCDTAVYSSSKTLP